MTLAVRLGVDTGGTFTDFVWLDSDGRIRIHKQLSTPDDPSRSILDGLEHLGLPDEGEVVHGSTVATNALLERKGARTALITTDGFEDVLAIGRQNRPEIYALTPVKPEPLVPTALRFGLPERIISTGEIERPLREEDIAPVVMQLRDEGIESLAVCFLFSFLRPDHEQLVRRIFHRYLPQCHVSLSAEILPEYREYERTSTTVVNAYVAPLMERYVSRLARGLSKRRLQVMQSNGGVIRADKAGKEAARTVLSGPAGGVVGAHYVAQLAGLEEIITFDMGGTSTDVALCPGRLPATSRGQIAGFPLRLPIIDIHTVGAGGGSLAYLDAGGALHAGPQSAGADPGPACYGRDDGSWQLMVQGRQVPFRVTTTDANLALGRLDANHFLGGNMRLDEAAAQNNLARLAVALGKGTAAEAAWDVITVANANMERAIRRVSVERGYDPRRFSLVAFGGAGPLHACDMAANLSIPRVLVPTAPGVLSALGMLVASPTKDFSRTVMLAAGNDEAFMTPLVAGFHPLEARALQQMAEEGYPVENLSLHRSLDMRYRGQAHELNIPFASGDADGLLAAFHLAHDRTYGYQRPQTAVEIVTIRLSVVASVAKPILTKGSRATGRAEATALIGRKEVWFAGHPQEAVLFDRHRLQPGHAFGGPAIVAQYDTTTVVPPNWGAQVDDFGNILLTHSV